MSLRTRILLVDDESGVAWVRKGDGTWTTLAGSETAPAADIADAVLIGGTPKQIQYLTEKINEILAVLREIGILES